MLLIVLFAVLLLLLLLILLVLFWMSLVSVVFVVVIVELIAKWDVCYSLLTTFTFAFGMPNIIRHAYRLILLGMPRLHIFFFCAADTVLHFYNIVIHFSGSFFYFIVADKHVLTTFLSPFILLELPALLEQFIPFKRMSYICYAAFSRAVTLKP